MVDPSTTMELTSWCTVMINVLICTEIILKIAEECAFQMSFSIKYSLLVTSSLTSVTIGSVMNIMQNMLPYQVWLPYDSTLSLAFWITSAQQIITVIISAIISVGTETLIFGLFFQTCAQFEIFERRLQRWVIDKTIARLTIGRGQSCFSAADHEEKLISGCIRHHLNIYEYAKAINNVFNQVFFVQFFGSVIVLCTSVYYVSSHIMESETATLLIYTIGMFIQIFVYCWSGNEVTLKSLNVGDAVYHTDWPLLTVSERRDLLMIMNRSTNAIKFTSSFLITLSIQSYSSILKASYSTFNVLQQSGGGNS